MREIKLRYWCKEHGMLTNYPDGGVNELFFNQRGEVGRPCPICYKSRPLTILQYTGLKDKNGMEIYEGDILEYVSPEPQEDDTPDRYIVEWKGFGWEATWQNAHKPTYVSDGRLSLQGCDEDMKVIGNIYENSELIEANK